MNLFIIKIDCGNGYVNYYQPTTIDKLKKFIKNRGCKKIVLRVDGKNKEMLPNEII